eukprot:1210816-Rhodomonas_salina.1
MSNNYLKGTPINFRRQTSHLGLLLEYPGTRVPRVPPGYRDPGRVPAGGYPGTALAGAGSLLHSGRKMQWTFGVRWSCCGWKPGGCTQAHQCRALCGGSVSPPISGRGGDEVVDFGL